MKETRYYHNPNCSKSRQGLDLLTQSKADFKIIRYLDTPLTAEEIEHIINTYKGSLNDLIRQNDAKKLELSLDALQDKETLIESILKHPIILQRPILSSPTETKLGRPPENLL